MKMIEISLLLFAWF